LHCKHCAYNRAVRRLAIGDASARAVKERVRDLLWRNLLSSGLTARDAVREMEANADE